MVAGAVRPHEGNPSAIRRAGRLLVIKRVPTEVLWSLQRRQKRDLALEAVAAALVESGPDLLVLPHFLRRETAVEEKTAVEARKCLFFRTK